MLKEELIKIFGSESAIPDVFNPDKLDLIDRDGVAFWDEMHRKCHNSTYGGEVKQQYIFARDKDGTNTTVRSEQLTSLERHLSININTHKS